MCPDTTKFGKITQNKGYFAVQFHSRSPIFVAIESLYTTYYHKNSSGQHPDSSILQSVPRRAGQLPRRPAPSVSIIDFYFRFRSAAFQPPATAIGFTVAIDDWRHRWYSASEPHLIVVVGIGHSRRLSRAIDTFGCTTRIPTLIHHRHHQAIYSATTYKL